MHNVNPSKSKHYPTLGFSSSEKKWIGRFILKELALDLRQCHKAGYNHGDVKPDNILITKNTVSLADYGMASKSDKNPENKRRGTANYMTAWNMENDVNDKTMDVYNVGLCWLYYTMGCVEFLDFISINIRWDQLEPIRKEYNKARRKKTRG